MVLLFVADAYSQQGREERSANVVRRNVLYDFLTWPGT